MTDTISIDLGLTKPVKIEVNYFFEKGEPRTFDYPGSDDEWDIESYEIISVHYDDEMKEIAEMLNRDPRTIERRIIEKLEILREERRREED